MNDLPRQMDSALPPVEETPVPTKIVAKPVLNKMPKPAPKTRKKVELSPPGQEASASPATASQGLPKTSEASWPFPASSAAPEPVKSIPPQAMPVLEPIQKPVPVLAKIEKNAVPPPLEKKVEAAVPPPLEKKAEPAIPKLEVKLQRGESAVAAPVPPAPVVPPSLEKITKPAEALAPGIPKLEAIVKEKAPEPVTPPTPKVIIENIIRKDELFVVYGISDSEIDFRGTYTRAHLSSLNGDGIKEKAQNLLIDMYKEDCKDPAFGRDWVNRERKGHCSLRGFKGNNPYVNFIEAIAVSDDGEDMNVATWSDMEREVEPFVVYRYVIFRTSMNERAPRIPLHLIF